MKAWVVAFGCWGMLSVAQAADTPSKLQQEHREAAALLTAEKWEAAVEAYRSIVAGGSDDALVLNAQLGGARALAGAGKFDQACREYLKLETLIATRKAGATLRKQQPEEAWIHAVHRGIGEVRERQGMHEAATASYMIAVKALGPEGSVADWRARAWLDVARCLVSIDKRKVAIVLLTKIIPELDPPEFAGMRALVKATLARIYMEDSERDWAVTLLEEIRSDPQLDPQQFAAAEAMAEGRPWKQPVTGRMRTRKGADYLAIESVGRFELRIALQPNGRNIFGENRYGWITAWYNLEEDPFKTTNLSGRSHFPLINSHPTRWMERRNGEWKRFDSKRNQEYAKIVDLNQGMQKGPEPGQRGDVGFEVLEENFVRVRTRTRHHRWPFESFESTFYPTGQILVAARFNLEHENPPLRIGGISFNTVKNARINWREAVEGNSRMSGEGGHPFETPFVLAHSNTTPSFQRSMPDDILTFPALAHRTQSLVNDEKAMQWRRASLRFSCDPNAESQDFALQLRVYPRTLDSFATAMPYVEDFQVPAELAVRNGSVVKNDAGDLDGDGFNESEGCYVVRGGDSVTLVAGKTARHQPVIKFLGSKLNGIPDLLMNGNPAGKATYNLVPIGAKSLLLQWLSVIPAGERVEFTLK